MGEGPDVSHSTLETSSGVLNLTKLIVGCKKLNWSDVQTSLPFIPLLGRKLYPPFHQN